jgi:ketosteroid isomerase-like protein
MRRFHGPLLFLAIVGLAVAHCGGATEPDAGLQELVLAERSFARASVDNGMREAFLRFLAEESVIFRPGPVDGRPWFEQRPPVQGTLSWQPLFADLSRSGDMGYTTGPWQFTPPAGEPAFGHYISIWSRQDDGAWRVVVDIGNSHPKPRSALGDLGFAPRDRASVNLRSTGDATPPSDGLLAAEKGYAERAAASSAEACSRYASDGLRLYRQGVLPWIGKQSACSALKKQNERADYQPVGSAVARSGDLGYVYGTLTTIPADAQQEGGPGSFLRIWSKNAEDDWRLVLEVAIPHPPAPSEN